ncbi:GyrI-like domain-containing protein [candidate division KSB1 bacterium]|nr:GyrI-like domain-containing protein [candidate division KSB1 bacterium]RQW06216.1 MAG: GyrI-like domain-containing protein [candidate division KSB1 bacterium]
MENNIELISRDERKALIIRATVGVLKLPRVIGPAYMKIDAFLRAHGIEPKEAPFTCFQIDDWDKAVHMSGLKSLLATFTKKLNVEMGFEVTANVRGDESIEQIILPAGHYYRAFHFGHYNKITALYREIYDRARQENYTLDNRCYEYYLNSPKEVPMDKLETHVLVRAIK